MDELQFLSRFGKGARGEGGGEASTARARPPRDAAGQDVSYTSWMGRDWAISSASDDEVEVLAIESHALMSYQVISLSELIPELARSEHVAPNRSPKTSSPMCCGWSTPADPWNVLRSSEGVPPPYRPLHEVRILKESNGEFACGNSRFVAIFAPSAFPEGPGRWRLKWYRMLPPTLSTPLNDDDGNNNDATAVTMTTIALSPGGDFLLCGTTSGMCMYSTGTGGSTEPPLWENDLDLPCKNVIMSGFSSDGRLFATCARDSRFVMVWWRDEGARERSRTFKYRMLAHSDSCVTRMSWRPRIGASQTLLTVTREGAIRLFQESDVYEDFQFDVVAHLHCNQPSDSFVVEWLRFIPEYAGLLWPPPQTSSSSPLATTTTTPTPNNNGGGADNSTTALLPPALTLITSKPRANWGAMERGHGHTSYGDAIFESAEARLGSTFSTAKSLARDWIAIYSSLHGSLRVYWTEALGEHARRGLRTEAFFECARVAVPRWERAANVGWNGSFAACRVQVPACTDVASFPHRPNELSAHNPPLEFFVAFRDADRGSLHRVTFTLEKDTSTANASFTSTQDYGRVNRLVRAADPDVPEVACLSSSSSFVFYRKPSAARGVELAGIGSVDLGDERLADVAYAKDGTLFVLGEEGRVVSLVPAGANRVQKEVCQFTWETNGAGETPKLAVFLIVLHGGETICAARGRRVYIHGRGEAESFITTSHDVFGEEYGLISITCGCEGGSRYPNTLFLGTNTGEAVEVELLDTQSASRTIVARRAKFSHELHRKVKGKEIRAVTSSGATGRLAMLSEEGGVHVAESRFDEATTGRLTPRAVDISWCDFGAGLEALMVMEADGSAHIFSHRRVEGLDTVAATPAAEEWIRVGRTHAFSSGRRRGAPASSPPALLTNGSTNASDIPEPCRGLLTWLSRDGFLILDPRRGVVDVFSDRLARAPGETITRRLQAYQRALPEEDPVQLEAYHAMGLFRELEGALAGLQVKMKREETSELGSEREIPNVLREGSFISPLENPTTKDEGSPTSTVDTDYLIKRLAMPQPRDSAETLWRRRATADVVMTYERANESTLRIAKQRNALDEMGVRFLAAVHRAAKDEGVELRTSDLVFAVFAPRDNEVALLSAVIAASNPAGGPPNPNAPLTWEEARALGLGFWLTDRELVRSTAERVARTQFVRSNRDPFSALLFYVMLGKANVAAALFRGAKNDRVAEMLSRDFKREARNREAAEKNAFVLLSKLRYEDAAAFFILAGKLEEAVRVCVRNLEDLQLALFILRCAYDDPSPRVASLIRDTALPAADACHDAFFRCVCLRLLASPDEHFAPVEESFLTFHEEEDADDGDDAIRKTSPKPPNSSSPSLTPALRDSQTASAVEWFRKLGSSQRPRLVRGFDPSETMFLRCLLSCSPQISRGPSLRARLVRYLRQTCFPRCVSWLVNRGLAITAAHLLLGARAGAGLEGGALELRSLEYDACLRVGFSRLSVSTAPGEDLALLARAFDLDQEAFVRDVERACVRAGDDVGHLRCAAAARGEDDTTRTSRVVDTLAEVVAASASRIASLGAEDVEARSICVREAGEVAAALDHELRKGTTNGGEFPASATVTVGYTLAALHAGRYRILKRLLFPSPQDDPDAPMLGAKEVDYLLRRAANRDASEGGGGDALFDEDDLDGEPTDEAGFPRRFVRAVMRYLAIRRLLAVVTLKDQRLAQAIGALLLRARRDVHYCTSPSGGDADIPSVVGALRPYMSTSGSSQSLRSFSSEEERDAWRALEGPEAIQGFANELACVGRHRAVYEAALSGAKANKNNKSGASGKSVIITAMTRSASYASNAIAQQTMAGFSRASSNPSPPPPPSTSNTVPRVPSRSSSPAFSTSTSTSSSSSLVSSATGTSGGSGSSRLETSATPAFSANASFVLYHRPGQTIRSVVVSKALPNYAILATEAGTRDVNIVSSLRHRERSPDGRLLLDAEKDSWAAVFGRFRSLETDGDEGGWEWLLFGGGLHRGGAEIAPTTATTTTTNPTGGMLVARAPISAASHSSAGQSIHRRSNSDVSLGVGKSQRHISLAPPPSTKFLFSFQQRARARVVSSGRYLAERVTHDEVPSTKLASHPFLPHYASGGMDGNVLLWRVGEPRAVARFAGSSYPSSSSSFSSPGSSHVTRVRFSQCGSKVAAVDASGRLSVWTLDVDPGSLAPYLTQAAHAKAASDVVFLNLTSVFCTASSNPASRGEIAVFDALLPPRARKVASCTLNAAEPSAAGIFSLAYSHHSPNRVIVGGALGGASSVSTGGSSGAGGSGGAGGTGGGGGGGVYGGGGGVLASYELRMNRFDTRATVAKAHARAVTSIEFEPSRGSFFATGSADGAVKFWSGRDLTLLATLPNLHPPPAPSASSVIAAATTVGGGGVHPANVGVTGIAFAENGAFVSCGGNDGCVKSTHTGSLVI